MGLHFSGIVVDGLEERRQWDDFSGMENMVQSVDIRVYMDVMMWCTEFSGKIEHGLLG